MRIIVVVDDAGGMLFNHRRQSKDRVLREKIVSLTSNSTLWMNEYSSQQFDCLPENIRISERFWAEASEEDYCFIEDKSVKEMNTPIQELILFHWNRRYPGDFYFDYSPMENSMKLTRTEEFVGSSHEKITMEVWKNEAN